MQPIRELDQQHSDVVGNGQEQFTEVLGLLCFLCDEIELFELCEPLDQCADVSTEHLVDFDPGGCGILDGVMQEGGRYGCIIELEVGEDRGHLERMGEIGVARRPLLLPMRPHRVDIRPIEKRLARVGIVPLHALDQIVLPHHGGLAGCRFNFTGESNIRIQRSDCAERGTIPRLVLHAWKVGRRTRHVESPAPRAV